MTGWREIVAVFLRLGATAYGGPAIMGIMQAELLDRRRWVSRERFVEGLSLVNMLPGATATQLGIFLAHARGGWWGGLLGGLCFVLPAFFVMLALTIAYAALGVTPLLRGALHGLGPVVLGIFVVAVYRLGRSTATRPPPRRSRARSASRPSCSWPAPPGCSSIIRGGHGRCWPPPRPPSWPCYRRSGGRRRSRRRPLRAPRRIRRACWRSGCTSSRWAPSPWAAA